MRAIFPQHVRIYHEKCAKGIRKSSSPFIRQTLAELIPMCTKGDGRYLDELLLEPAFKLFSHGFLAKRVAPKQGTRVSYIHYLQSHASPVDTVMEIGVSHVYTTFSLMLLLRSLGSNAFDSGVAELGHQDIYIYIRSSPLLRF